MTTSSERAVRLEWDEHGNIRPLSTEQCIALFTEWACHYPTARFAVIAIEPDGTDAEALGWGLALPDHVFAYLPAIGMTARFGTPAELLGVLNTGMRAHLIWVDPQPDPWPAEPKG